MSLEYVKFSASESLYGEKNLLISELGILQFVKRIKNYKKLRQEELNMKILLKKKMDELIEMLSILDKMLPHTKMAGLIKEKKHHLKDRMEGMSEDDKESYTLEQEVERIRRKLEVLREY
ncbi:MAG: hypothetical protein Q7S27_05095 [Nanoarchaeota archaeon]|nr:hypothetical protein [Nanoarchaeota archaeon]